jgi:CheY-like chemotaxis protein
MELSMQPFDPRACLSAALDLVAHEAARKGLALVCEVDATVPDALSGDGPRLRQVLVNLLGNAVKFTEHGVVTLAAGGRPFAQGAFELTVSISDTGIGIPQNQLEQIFQPFVQVDDATTRRFGGTGLGLAISRQIIEQMGGRIAVMSIPGAGSTFTLTLRLAEAQPLVVIPAADSHAAGALPPGLRILLAEDNLINQEVLRRLLESLGYTPDIVANGAQALGAVSQQPYDVVLMDIQMPELDGEAATRRIRALSGIMQPRIIALTASALRGDRERYLAAGMDDYLSKPVQRDELRDILVRSIAGGIAPDPQLAVPEQDASVIDWDMLDRMLEALDETPAAAAVVVLELYRTVLAAQLEEIGAAVVAADRPLVQRLAHKLRGGCRQIGAALLVVRLTALEAEAATPAGPLAALLEDIRRAYDKTLALLAARFAADKQVHEI